VIEAHLQNEPWLSFLKRASDPGEYLQLQLRIPDRFGNYVEPQEWFVVPLPVIDEVIQRIQDDTITDFVYDVRTGKLRKA
jgi:hypothetical protein